MNVKCMNMKFFIIIIFFDPHTKMISNIWKIIRPKNHVVFILKIFHLNIVNVLLSILFLSEKIMNNV